MKAGSGSIGVLLGILLVVVVFAPVPSDTRLLDTLHNAAHGLIFGCVGLLLLLWLRVRAISATRPVARQYAIAFVIACGLGLGTELAQLLTGRDASWMDARNDALGALTFLLIFFAFDARVRAQSAPPTRMFAVLVGLGLFGFLVAPVARAGFEYRQRDQLFPTLADFTHGYDGYFIVQRSAVLSPIALPSRWAAAPGETALHIRLQAGAYPGIEFTEPLSDWTAYSKLLLDLTNPGSADLLLTLRIHDAAHTWEFGDRFNGRLLMRAGSREVVRIAFEDVRRAPQGRAMQLDAIAGMMLFAAEPSRGEFFVSRVWLE